MTSNTKDDTIPGSILNDNWIFLKPIGWLKLKKRINKLHELVSRVVESSQNGSGPKQKWRQKGLLLLIILGIFLVMQQ